MTLQNFRSNPLSDRVVHALLKATEAYATMNVLLIEYPAYTHLLSDILICVNVGYMKRDAQHLIQSSYVRDQQESIRQYFDIISACK